MVEIVSQEPDVAGQHSKIADSEKGEEHLEEIKPGYVQKAKERRDTHSDRIDFVQEIDIGRQKDCRIDDPDGKN
jgi:hypothetical protein